MGGSFGGKTGHVFRFSCAQMLKKKGYLVSTILIGLVLFVGIIAIMAITSSKDKEKAAPTKVGTMIICNESDIKFAEGEEIDRTAMAEAIRIACDCKSASVEWKEEAVIANEVKAVEDASKGEKIDSFFAVLRNTDEGYGLFMVRPERCTWSEGEVTEAGNAIIPELKSYVERNVDPMKAAVIRIPTSSTTLVVGEDTSVVAQLVKYILPMISGMLMYFMVLAYGQDIARSVAAEKTSKLMEMLLSFVPPKALIMGKILAGFVMSVVQVMIWLVCGIGGYLVGGVIARSINPDYTDVIRKFFDMVRAVTGNSAMTIGPVILALVVLFLGLLIYYAIAGIGGSIVTKPEEIGSANAVITFPVLIFWLVGYFAALNQNEGLLTVCRYIPFAAPFTVTAEILVGKVSITTALIIVVEMYICTMLMVWLAAKIYKGLVLYTGEKLSLRKVFGVIRGK